MNLKLKLLMLWLVIWTCFIVIFPDVVSSHPHLKYSALLSPFIIMTLLLEPMELLREGVPIALLPGAYFWLVGICIFLIPTRLFIKNSNRK